MKAFFLIAIAGFLLTSCSHSTTTGKMTNSASPLPPLPEVTFDTPNVPDGARISLADAKKAYDDGNAVFVDVRSAETFAKEHVRGALNIIIGDLEDNKAKLPSNKKIVVYCSCGAEHSSVAWVMKAKEKGIDNAYALIGGTAAWVDAGYPVDKN
ncbi:MAG: rhodanese-like domain-containing protein [Acidobacteria bacterium]|nr:rhodanese-like domain-containing protein [Acidobacteriota bacterium]